MICQSDFYTGKMDYSKMLSDVAVKLHGIVMSEISTELAEIMHRKEYHPFSVFAVPHSDKLIIRVSILSEDANEVLGVFENKKKFKIYGMDTPLVITGMNKKEPLNTADTSIFGKSGRCRIGFVTPAMYKSKGKMVCKPDLEKYFYSVVLKYNAFEDDAIDFSLFSDALSECEYQSYSFQSNTYHVSGLKIRGMTGYCDLKMPGDFQKRELLLRVFQYASYSGVGGKTGMGMGGFTVSPL